MTNGSSVELELSQGRKGPTEYPIHPLISHRWSPRGIAEKPVEREKLLRCLEAARWAPSSRNAQPWRFLVATLGQPDWHARLAGYLSEGNYWAKRSPVLIASAYEMAHKDRPNPWACRDLGAAEQNMFLQAFAEGLVMHQMAGFDRQRLKDELLPEGFEPGAMTALFYLGDTNELSEKHRKAEDRPRKRNPLAEFVFGKRWGDPHAMLLKLEEI